MSPGHAATHPPHGSSNRPVGRCADRGSRRDQHNHENSFPMLKITPTRLDELEIEFPEIRSQVMGFEHAQLPPCPQCGSIDTAAVSVGGARRSQVIAAATSKIRLLPNGPAPGSHYCNTCSGFFGVPD